MVKKYLLSIILFLFGIGFRIAYWVISSDIGDDGILNEPLWLIPVGYTFLFVGILLALRTYRKERINEIDNKKK